MTRVVLWGLVGNSVSDARVIIAIDGPAGAGKSTIAKALAQAMKLQYLDTGAMFRAVTSTVLRLGIDPSDIEQVGALCEILSMEVLENQVIADGIAVTVDIRTPAVTKAASVIATNPLVRANLRSRQRAWTSVRGGGVVEGRDIGSVVFPDATLKVYLTATPRVRAGRRGSTCGTRVPCDRAGRCGAFGLASGAGLGTERAGRRGWARRQWRGRSFRGGYRWRR